jgi:hypothetical protein
MKYVSLLNSGKNINNGKIEMNNHMNNSEIKQSILEDNGEYVFNDEMIELHEECNDKLEVNIT